VSAITGIPMHWLGNVDVMSNRSTADSLYETINNATVGDRAVWSESMWELMFKAQKMAIDAGLDGAPDKLDDNFDVKIPLIPFTKMLEYVKALSLVLSDNGISLADYQNMLPGVDPYTVRKNLKKEAEDKAKATETLIKKTKIKDPEEDEELEND